MGKVTSEYFVDDFGETWLSFIKFYPGKFRLAEIHTYGKHRLHEPHTLVHSTDEPVPIRRLWEQL